MPLVGSSPYKRNLRLVSTLGRSSKYPRDIAPQRLAHRDDVLACVAAPFFNVIIRAEPTRNLE